MQRSFVSAKWGRMISVNFLSAKPMKMNNKYNNNFTCVGQANEQLKGKRNSNSFRQSIRRK